MNVDDVERNRFALHRVSLPATIWHKTLQTLLKIFKGKQKFWFEIFKTAVKYFPEILCTLSIPLKYVIEILQFF